MKARLLALAALAATALAVAGAASADVYGPADVGRPADAFRLPTSSSWSGLHVTGSTWSSLRPRATAGWTRLPN